MVLVNAHGIIRLALRSRLPRAEIFQGWVCWEILLPIIRRGKTGKSAWELVLEHFFLDIWVGFCYYK